MKNSKTIIIILAVVLLISLGGNVYLIANQSALNKQLAEVQNQLADANNKISDMENQLTDANNQITDLESQLATYTAKLGTIDTGYVADNTEDSEEIEIGNGTGTLLTEEENNYLEEAQNLWTEHQDELVCNEETFNEIYMGLRDSGKTPEEAYTEAYEQFKKEEEPQQTVEPQPEVTQQPATQQPSSGGNNNNTQNSGGNTNNNTSNQPGSMPTWGNGFGEGGNSGIGSGDGAGTGTFE